MFSPEHIFMNNFDYDDDDKYGTNRAPDEASDEDYEGGYELWSGKLFLQARLLYFL